MFGTAASLSEAVRKFLFTNMDFNIDLFNSSISPYCRI